MTDGEEAHDSGGGGGVMIDGRAACCEQGRTDPCRSTPTYPLYLSSGHLIGGAGREVVTADGAAAGDRRDCDDHDDDSGDHGHYCR